jgi:hypothetical protein
MKWTNRGHEFDKVGADYCAVKTIYIWGAGKLCLEALKFLNWKPEFKEFEIKIVDSDTKKQGSMVNNHMVFSPKIIKQADMQASVVLVTPADKTIEETLKLWNVKYCFNWVSRYNSDKNFISNFVAIWLMYKHNQLIHPWAEYIVTNICNLKCKGCLNFNNYIKDRWTVDLQKFKEHIDTFWQKWNECYSFHFCGGEPPLNKYFPELITYFMDNYASRVYSQIFFITNGTLLFKEELLDVLKKYNICVHIDDYRKFVPLAADMFPKLTEQLCENGIEHKVLYTERWFDVDIENADYSYLPEADLIAHRDNCNRLYQTFNNGRIYSCCYPEYAHNSQAVDEKEVDRLDIASSSKIELLEYSLGFTESGYTPMCKRCNGLGADSKLMPCAEQEI